MTRADLDQLRTMLEEVAADLAAAPDRIEREHRERYEKRAAENPGLARYSDHYPGMVGALQAIAEINGQRIRAISKAFLAPRPRRRRRSA